MFDHVGLAVSDLTASERFYRTVLSVLGSEPSYVSTDMVGWDDWWIGQADDEHPVTRGLHVGFRAPSREAVDAFWQAGIKRGLSCAGHEAPAHRTAPFASPFGYIRQAARLRDEQPGSVGMCL